MFTPHKNPNTFQTTPRSATKGVLENPMWSAKRPAPTLLRNTPDFIDIPLGRFIAPRLPDCSAPAFREHMENFVYRLDFRWLRRAYTTWVYCSD
jgi:hypothetical protein